MTVKKIYYTSRFIKRFRKLPKKVKTLAIKKERMFREDPTNPLLKTHQLKGELKGFSSFSINYHYRIMFKFERDGSATFIDVGTHSIYK